MKTHHCLFNTIINIIFELIITTISICITVVKNID